MELAENPAFALFSCRNPSGSLCVFIIAQGKTCAEHGIIRQPDV